MGRYHDRSHTFCSFACFCAAKSKWSFSLHKKYDYLTNMHVFHCTFKKIHIIASRMLYFGWRCSTIFIVKTENRWPFVFWLWFNSYISLVISESELKMQHNCERRSGLRCQQGTCWYLSRSEESCSTLEFTKTVAHVMYSGAVDGMAVEILNIRGHLWLDHRSWFV